MQGSLLANSNLMLCLIKASTESNFAPLRPHELAYETQKCRIDP